MLTEILSGDMSSRFRKHLAALPSSARPGGVPGLMDRLGRWWGERILIPGFPARMAYAATVVLVLLTAVPGAPLRGVSRTALKVATAGPTAVPAVAEASAWLDGQLAEVRGDVVAQWQVVDGNLGARLARTAEARRQAAGHLSAAWRELEDHLHAVDRHRLACLADLLRRWDQ